MDSLNRASTSGSKDYSVTRHSDDNRTRSVRGAVGPPYTAGQAGGTGRASGSRRPTTGRASERGLTLPPEAFATPALDVETTTSQNALWIHVRGEADLGNHEVLHARLGQVRLDQAKAVHLVLSELTFIDVCAFRHLVAFATRVRSAGRELSAHGACPTLKKIARLLNVSQELHFV